MSKQILKVERLSSRWWQYSREDGQLITQRRPTDEEIEAMGDDNKMYVIYTHGKFSSRLSGPTW